MNRFIDLLMFLVAAIFGIIMTIVNGIVEVFKMLFDLF
jgi:hypothetical protein